MKTLLILIGVVSGMNLYSQTWQPVDSVETQYNHIYFYNSQVGYLSGYGYYKKTDDGGHTWTTVNVPGMENIDIGNIYFLNSDTGFMTFNVTYNGGNTWQNIDYPQSVYCFTENNRYAFSAAFMPFGDSAPTFKSTDGGIDWDMKAWVVPDPNSDEGWVTGISFADSMNGIISGTSGNIFVTHNGAASYEIKRPLGLYTNMTAVFMTSASMAYVGTDGGIILKTTDGGETWNSISSVYDEVKKIVFLDSLNGFLISPYSLFSTRDAGQTWVYDTAAFGAIDFCFVNPHEGFLLTWDSVFSHGGVLRMEIFNSVAEVNTVEKISIYPNPSTGTWQLSVGEELTGAQLEAYDEQGRVVFKSTIRNLQSVINMEVPPGIYYLRISNDKASVVRKLVKM